MYNALKRKHLVINYFTAGVWLINGFLCKVLNLVPRHQEIVAKIIGEGHARGATILIGIAEIFMSLWILSRIASKLNAIMQILTISTMNIIEFFLVPQLLLWGKANSVFALAFIILIWYNEFHLNKKSIVFI